MANILSLTELVIEDDSPQGLYAAAMATCGLTSAISDHC